MKPDVISAIFGGCVMLLGVLLQLTHRATWLRERNEFANDPRELRHYESRFRRRSPTSGLIALIGILIPLADLPDVWKQLGPLASAILWTAIGGLCVWVGLLAIGDWATTRAHSRAVLARLEAHKHELMDQLERLRPPANVDEK
jgi:hypothetical protein